MKVALVFAASFASAAALASLCGCLQEGLGSDCDCRPTPARPEPQAPLGELTVISYDAQGNHTPPPVTPVSGTIEVTSDSVIVAYEQDSAHFRVEYEIFNLAQ